MNWADIVKAAVSKYHLDTSETDPGLKTAIANQATFNLHSGLESTKIPRGLTRFRSQDVEPLLDQASIILEKALSDRDKWQSAGEKFANLILDVSNSIRLDAISIAEEADGRFDFEKYTTGSQKKANDAKLRAAEAQQAALTALLERVDINAVHGGRSLELVGVLEYIRTMYLPTWGLKIKWPTDGLTQQDDWVNSYIARIGDQAANNANKEILSVTSNLKAASGEADAARVMVEGLSQQARWSEKNVGHLHDRAETARQTLQMKVTMMAVTSLLDFERQLESAKTRYVEAVSDAYLRLTIVEQGLGLFYDYPHPDRDPLPTLASDDPSSFDAILSWSRRVARWLAAFSRRSNNYVLTLSVKALAGSQWETGKATGSWKFPLPMQTFDPGECHVRVRGVAAWAPGSDDRLWQVTLRCPAVTQVRYESGALSEPFSQDVGVCRVSKVVARSRLVAPEISGATLLFNASPIGEWEVTLRSAYDRSSVPATWPDDVEVDLYLSVLTVSP